MSTTRSRDLIPLPAFSTLVAASRDDSFQLDIIRKHVVGFGNGIGDLLNHFQCRVFSFSLGQAPEFGPILRILRHSAFEFLLNRIGHLLEVLLKSCHRIVKPVAEACRQHGQAFHTIGQDESLNDRQFFVEKDVPLLLDNEKFQRPHEQNAKVFDIPRLDDVFVNRAFVDRLNGRREIGIGRG